MALYAKNICLNGTTTVLGDFTIDVAHGNVFIDGIAPAHAPGNGMIRFLLILVIQNQLSNGGTYGGGSTLTLKKLCKNITPKGIDFVKSYCKIKVRDILKKLEDIPYFEQNNKYIRINNVLVIVYIAHKARLEFL